MKEKTKKNLIAYWNLEGTDKQLSEIESRWGYEKFMKSYYLQSEFSKKYKGYGTPR